MCAAKIRVRRQTLKTRLACESSMCPAATRPAWSHERVELERIVDCGGFECTPPNPPGYGHELCNYTRTVIIVGSVYPLHNLKGRFCGHNEINCILISLFSFNKCLLLNIQE